MSSSLNSSSVVVLLALAYLALPNFAFGEENNEQKKQSNVVEEKQKKQFADLSRPANKSKKYIGRLIFKQTEPGKVWPYLEVNWLKKDQKKEYRLIIDPDKENSQEQIALITEAKESSDELYSFIGEEASENGEEAILVDSIKAQSIEDAKFDEYFKFVLVKPGDFMMGYPIDGANEEYETEFFHKEEITRPYQIGVYEVTQGIWIKMMGSLPPEFEKHRKLLRSQNRDDSHLVDDLLPVNFVKYIEVEEFCRRLTKELNDGFTYHPPTEAQWEYAVRGGHKVKFEERSRPFNFASYPKKLAEYEQFNKSFEDYDNGNALLRVGTKKANPLGLYNVYGNLMEWTSDKFFRDRRKLKVHPDYGHPVFLDPASQEPHVIKGGSWTVAPLTITWGAVTPTKYMKLLRPGHILDFVLREHLIWEIKRANR